MECHDVRIQLAALSRGEVDAITANELHTHLDACPLCQRAYQIVSEIDAPATDPAIPVPAPNRNSMAFRLWTIGSTTVIAAAVMITALLLGSQPVKGPEPAGPQKVDVEGWKFFGSNDFIKQPQHFIQANPPNVENGRYRRTTESGQEQILFWSRINPASAGVWEVENPGAWIHLIPGQRVVQIQALEGTFEAPENQLHSGQFRRDVVVTFFEVDRPEDRVVNLESNSPDVRLQLFLEEVKFDLELGRLESDKHVHLTGPRMDFHGKGLVLVFNEQLQRIERLEIAQGEQFRFKPQGNSQDDLFSAVGRKTDTKQPEPTGNREQPKETEQFYRATLRNQVVIRTPQAIFEADELVMIFALSATQQKSAFEQFGRGGSAPGVLAASEDSRVTAGSGLSGGELGTIAARIIALCLVQVETGRSTTQRSLAPIDPKDVTITWRGPMFVKPIEMPDGLRGPDEQMVQLAGRPVRITTTNKEVITAANLAYVTSNSVIHVTGSQQYPLKVDAPNLGKLTGTRLVINQHTGIGVLEGPGSLVAHDKPTITDAIETGGMLMADAHRLPPDLKVTWQKRVDLNFYHDSGPDESSDRIKQVAALRRATFVGDVTVQHPQLELYAQRLSLGLSDPAGGEPTVTGIDAVGGVRVWARDGQDALAVESEELNIELRADANDHVQLRKILARHQVTASHMESTLRSELLVVEFGEPEQQSPTTDLIKRKNIDVMVKSLLAEQDVRIEIAEEQIALGGHRLEVDLATGRLEMLGTEKQQAYVMRRDGMLSGRYITMVHLGGSVEDRQQIVGTVHVDGPGRFEFVIDEGPAPIEGSDGDSPGQFVPDPTRLVQIAWNESMHFDQRKKKVRFVGKVVVDGRKETDTTTLKANELHLSFFDLAEAESSGRRPEDPHPIVGDAGGAMVKHMRRGDQSIQSVDAEGDAEFLAENWVNGPGGKLATRVRLVGPSIRFNNTSEQVRVDGPGNMLVQDEQSKRDAATGRKQPKPEDPMVAFGGKGDTVFKWQGSLQLNAFHNDMILTDKVQMFHRPPGETHVLELRCRLFKANLEPSGGLNAWLDQHGPQPRIMAVTADDQVLVRHGETTVVTDHLKYHGKAADEKPQTLELFAERGRMTRITDAGNPTPHTAERFTWDLVRNLITIDEVGAATVPVKKDLLREKGKSKKKKNP